MSPGDVVTGIAWIVVIGAALALAARSSSASRHAAEAKKQEAEVQARLAQEAKAAEQDFIREAQALLPNWPNALLHLKQRFGWIEMLDCIGVNQLHLRQLRQTFGNDEVDLPNMLMMRIDADARRVYREANALTQEPGWPEDVESMIQEPTVQTVLELARMDYLLAKPIGNEPTRRYSVSLTPTGEALKELDMKFRDPSDRHEKWPYATPDPESRKQVARVVGTTIALAAAGAA